MLYLWIKSAHLLAVIIWMSGMLAAPIIVSLLGPDATPAQRRRLKALFSRVVTPSMLVSLILGIWLMVSGDWFDARWMQAKLLAVIAMTAIHGLLSGMLRRYATDDAQIELKRLNVIRSLTAVLLVLIVIFVTTKIVP